MLARCLRFHCAVFACVETTDAMNVLRCVEWRAGGHGGRFVEFLDETQEWIMARCKQSSTRPPNCNFLCLILVTEWKKFNEYIYIYFLHSSPFYFFEKLLLIPSFSFFSLFPIFGKADCFQGLNYRCSKKISIFLLVRSIIFIQLQFSSCLNILELFNRKSILLFISLSSILLILSPLSFPYISFLRKIYYDSIYPRDIKLDRIFENNQSSRWVSPNSNNFRPRQLFLSLRTSELYRYWPIFNEY